MISDVEILKLIDNGVIENADKNSVGPISYDLSTRAFYDKGGESPEASLAPGESVFVGSEETIALPDNLAAMVALKNSRIRQGLSLDAPVYFPGHHTRVFFRVTNVSSSEILLTKNKGMAQLVFSRIEGSVAYPYEGTFANEFDYSGMAGYKDLYQEEMSLIDRKADEIKGMEARIYERTIALFAIFAAVFTLVNVNASLVVDVSLVSVDLSILGGFSALVGLIGFVLDSKNRAAKIAPLVIAAICFVAAAITAAVL